MPGTRRPRSTLGVVALAASFALLAGCGSGSEGEAALTVYVSAPSGGSAASSAADIADGARRALADAGGEAAGVPVRLVVLDDRIDGSADARAGANARTATEDSSAIAYIGEVDSGSTRTSLPITNEAGLLQVSAAASAVDLTRVAPGSDQIPDTVQPSGTRTFGRVIPSDTAQGAAAGAAMADRGAPSVTPIEAGSAYGQSLLDGVESVADGPEVVSGGGSAAALYVASDRPEESILDTGGDPPVVGADAQIAGEPPRTPLPPGSLLVSGAMAPSQLPEPAPDGNRGRFGAYGYEAMAVVLDSIERANDPLDRSSVIDAFFATTDRDSVLGSYSIDETGDTTLAQVGAYVARGGGGLEPTPEPLTVP